MCRIKYTRIFIHLTKKAFASIQQIICLKLQGNVLVNYLIINLVFLEKESKVFYNNGIYYTSVKKLIIVFTFPIHNDPFVCLTVWSFELGRDQWSFSQNWPWGFTKMQEKDNGSEFNLIKILSYYCYKGGGGFECY